MCRSSGISGRVRDGIWGGRGSAPGRRLGPARHRQPRAGESCGLLAELGGTSGTCAGGDTVPEPPQHLPLSHTPQVSHTPGVLVPEGSGLLAEGWERSGHGGVTAPSHPPHSRCVREERLPAAGRSFPPYRGRRLGLALPAASLPQMFSRGSPDTKPVEQSSCRNGSSPAHCPSWLAAGWVMVCPSEELGLKVPFICGSCQLPQKTQTTGTRVPNATGPQCQVQPAADGLHQ